MYLCKVNIDLLYDPTIWLLSLYPKDMKTYVWAPMSISDAFITAQNQNSNVLQWVNSWTNCSTSTQRILPWIKGTKHWCTQVGSLSKTWYYMKEAILKWLHIALFLLYCILKNAKLYKDREQIVLLYSLLCLCGIVWHSTL